MYCRRCKIKMAEERGTHHKRKRWRCPQCKRARHESVTVKRKQKQRHGRRQSDEW